MDNELRLFTCTDHKGHYPVGVASIVLAETEPEAYQMLRDALNDAGLDGDAEFTLTEVYFDKQVIILHDGNY